ncbi:hypothetical protein FOMPIDRAFT_1128951 [Fomitopsis schrenkii]|uniref:N-acetyltransferase domain-containing protein n=1 Tax=Fomitopsis schrenkii TaxID=2126942 RepID=S8FFN9_FOMSC|nr:hypothetical protein FOMPIDRAFT_1128951 [Fomitopsis schrenkii]
MQAGRYVVVVNTVSPDVIGIDPLAIAFTGGDVRILPYLIRAMVGAIAFMCGDIYAAFNEQGVMVGFQGWVPPGQLLFSTSEEQRVLLRDFNSRLSEKAKDYFPRACELNTYWCNFNFVAEEYQQQGISKAMTDLAYQKAKSNGWAMALATTHVRNIAIYNRLDFELMGYRNMQSPFIDWQVWIYVRRP